MITLKKLLLATAIASFVTNAFALESLDEGDLSETVAQQGMDIFTTLNISGGKLTITDGDGYTLPAPAVPPASTVYANSGDLNINGLGMTGSTKITVDVGATTAGPNAALFLGIEGTTALAYQLTSITVNKTGNTTEYPVLTMPAGTSISIASGYKLALELGVGPSGHLGVLTGNIGTITIGSNGTATQKVAITDSANGGTMGVSRYELTGVNLGSGSGNQTNIDVCSGASSANCTAAEPGLKITFAGTAMNAIGLTMNDVRLGSSTGPIVGQMSMTGLNLSGTSLRMVGH